MLAPEAHWAHQISTTSVCHPKTPEGHLTGCSNCTRLLQHEKKRYIMTPKQFEQCVMAAKDFAVDSAPCPQGRRKVVGVFGGDPLLSPFFPQYVEIMCDNIPLIHRGLWTSIEYRGYSHPRYGAAEPLVDRLIGKRPGGVFLHNHGGNGYLNKNPHDNFNPASHAQTCQHQPVLVAIKDVVKDEKKMWDLIEKCWIPTEWSAAYALDANNEPKFWWCEIASAHDRIFNLGVGLQVEKDCWRGPLTFERDGNGVLRPKGKFAKQIEACCTGCGAAIPLPGRRDLDYKDDISPSNLVQLQTLGSPMVARGDYVAFGEDKIAVYNEERNRDGWNPKKYIK